MMYVLKKCCQPPAISEMNLKQDHTERSAPYASPEKDFWIKTRKKKEKLGFKKIKYIIFKKKKTKKAENNLSNTRDTKINCTEYT